MMEDEGDRSTNAMTRRRACQRLLALARITTSFIR
jgi:hypothetical protein